MPLFYITGVSGTGKSTVLDELQSRGFEAHGVDEYGIADWISRKTGQVDKFPHGAKDFDFHKWYEEHRWVLSDKKVSELKRQADAARKPIFLCGATEGDKEVWHYFDKVIALFADKETIKQRIASRNNNEFGKTATELQEILDWHAIFEETYKSRGAVLVDATRPIKTVVDEILKASNQKVV